MSLPNEFRLVPEFLCVDSTADENGEIQKKPCATAFFVAVPIDPNSHMVYLVTARHVVDRSREHGRLYVRFDMHGSNEPFYYLPIDQDSFIFNPRTDVAVCQLRPVEGHLKIASMPMSALATREYIMDHPLNLGDDVYIAGLFTEYHGRERNQPILRFGKISLIPDERVKLQLSPESEKIPVEAYLIETLSWGGESGAPVFIHKAPDPNYKLLGLVHGHYPIRQDVIEKKEKIGEVDLNAGIMVVIPAQAIIDTINQEELVKQREQAKREIENNQPVPIPDSGLSPKKFTRNEGKSFGRFHLSSFDLRSSVR